MRKYIFHHFENKITHFLLGTAAQADVPEAKEVIFQVVLRELVFQRAVVRQQMQNKPKQYHSDISG